MSNPKVTVNQNPHSVCLTSPARNYHFSCHIDGLHAKFCLSNAQPNPAKEIQTLITLRTLDLKRSKKTDEVSEED